MSSIQIIKTLYKAFKRNGDELFRKICDVNIEWIQNKGFPNGGHYHGADAVKDAGLLPKFLTKHRIEVSRDYQNDVFDKLTTSVEELTGQKPTDMRTFVESNKSYFTPEYLQAYAEKMAAEKQAA